MKILFCLFIFTASAVAQTPWVQTLIVTNVCQVVPDPQDTNALTTICRAQTNTVIIPAGQAARVTMFSPLDLGAGPLIFSHNVTLVKEGKVWSVFKGDSVQGPAQFIIRSTEDASMLVTLERWRVPKIVPTK